MLTLVTLATRIDRYMPWFLESCRRHSVKLEVLGMGKPWPGFGGRLRAIHAWLRSHQESGGIILFADAHDSLVLQEADEILRKFRALGHPLVFSAEKNCYPDADRAGEYPASETPYRFLNAGGWIGEVGYVRDLFDRCRLDDLAPEAVDQRWLTELFLRSGSELVLDTRCELFQTVCLAEADLENAGGVFNRITGTMPSVLHANGRADLQPFLRWAGYDHV